VKGLKIEPRPETPVPLWLGGWGELALSRAAGLGDAWLPGPTANLEKLLQAQSQYHQNLHQLGINPADRPTPLTRELVIAKSDELAWEMAEKHLQINYRDEYGGGKWKHPLIGQEDATPVADLVAVSRDRFLVGSPATVIKQIQNFQASFGMDHLVCRLFFPGMPHDFIMSELRLLSREVIPVFR
jgi:alkanesulfonate monooxygenase SsuD/methylene tetrahydromethanopterin reductase-like flavin-dependent oxidoreductase (luciferase family)